MISRSNFLFARQRIVVVGDDSVVNAFVIASLRYDGHCVTHDTDARATLSDLALGDCHLVIMGTGIPEATYAELLDELLAHRPAVAILRLTGPSTLPAPRRDGRGRVPILREPFTAAGLQAAVRPLLPALRGGSVLALAVEALRAQQAR